MLGFGRKGHPRKHDIADALSHKGDIYDALIGAINALTAANVAVDKKTLDDAIAAAIVGMQWQPPIIRFEAMVTNEPALPSDGDRYISTEAGDIPSTTQAVLVDDVCEWDSGTSLWIVTTPEDGWAVIEQGVDPNIVWWYSGTAWRKLGTIVDHSNLFNLNWSVAGHVMDTVLDMNSNQINELADATLSTDAINRGQISYPSGAKFTYCSQSRGNDTTGDGSHAFPYATIQKAIDQIGENEHRIIIVDEDENSTTQNVTLPDAVSYRSATIVSYSGVMSWYGGINTLTLGNNWTIMCNSIQVGGIVETAGCTWAEVYMEEGHLSTVPNVPDTHLYFFGTIMPESVWDGIIANAKNGWAVTNSSPSKLLVSAGAKFDGKLEGLEPYQAIGYCVSNVRGTTEALGADGSDKNPYSTPDEAIAKGVLNGDSIITLMLDGRNSPTYTVNVPDGEIVSVSTLDPLASLATINVSVGEGSTFLADNITVSVLKEASSVTIGCDVAIEESVVNKITDFAETGYATLMTGLFSNILSTSTTLLTEINNMAGATGTIIFTKYGVESFICLNGIRGNGKEATNWADPTAAQSLATKNYVDGIATKSGKVLAATFAGNPKVATVTFATAFPDANYSVSIIGVDGRSWKVASQLAASFIIDSGSNVALTGDVSWTATPHYDP